ncbi:MAG: rhodanese-like domain-containing protein [Bilophila wadsworthia]
MHSLRSKWFAVLLACVFMFAAYGHSPAAELPQTGALAPAEALQLMDTLGDKLTVIDVRTEQEYAQGHVPGALLLPIRHCANIWVKSPPTAPSCSSAGPDAGLKRPTT